jgi:hypothetical protein
MRGEKVRLRCKTVGKRLSPRRRRRRRRRRNAYTVIVHCVLGM